MEILIPVTKVLRLEKSELQTQKIMSQRVQSQKSISKKVQEQKSQDENQNQKKVKKSVKWKITQEKDENELTQQKQDELQKQKNLKLNFQAQTDQQFKKHHQKIQCQLQKKSTRSSLHEIPDNLNLQYQNQSQLSHNNIITQKEMLSKNQRNQYFVKFHDNIANEIDETFCCKICLQQGNSNHSVQNQQNLLIRVCKCHDYVHIHCLQEWINHRDILNQSIQANQCQVCRQNYTISLDTQYFFSFKILKQNYRKQPFTVAKKFFLAFFSFLFSIFGLYLLIALFAQSGQNGGSIRQILGMPYVTCVTIVIFLLFIVLLICGIFTYTFILDLCLDFKYKIQKVTQQQQSSRNLQTLFTEWK